MRSIAVCAETFHANVVAAFAPSDDRQQNAGRSNRADYRRDPIAHGPAELAPAADEQPERHGRIDVTARDRADRVCHREQRQAEGEGDAEVADVIAGEHRRPNTAEHEHERTQQLCTGPLERHPSLLEVDRWGTSLSSLPAEESLPVWLSEARLACVPPRRRAHCPIARFSLMSEHGENNPCGAAAAVRLERPRTLQGCRAISRRIPGRRAHVLLAGRR